MIKYDKFEITKKVLELLPDTHEYKKYPLDKVVFMWWDGGRSSRSLRLTIEGKTEFERAGIVSYTVTIPEKMIEDYRAGQRILFNIGKKMPCPWYFTIKSPNNIVIYDSKIAVLIELYGDLYTYLESLK